MPCPVCHQSLFLPAVPRRRVEAEIRSREQFVRTRLRRSATRAELKDLTDFMHGFAAPLESCAHCGLLVRAEYRVRTAASYSQDVNDFDIMAQLLPRYVQAFGNKEPGYRDLLRPHAEVLELGSHLGAFLQVAEEWSWRPTGFDVGEDTAAFAKRNGFTVRRATVEDAAIRPRTFDAVFVWNCFEQLQEPAKTLAAVRHSLAHDGLLVVRVPNAAFYLSAQSSETALAWNNLLGFPYLYGYTEELVTRLVKQHGFQPVCGFDSELVTMPFPELRAPLAEEQRFFSHTVADRSVARTARKLRLSGPWIELVYRKVREPAFMPEVKRVEPLFLPRAA